MAGLLVGRSALLSDAQRACAPPLPSVGERSEHSASGGVFRVRGSSLPQRITADRWSLVVLGFGRRRAGRGGAGQVQREQAGEEFVVGQPDRPAAEAGYPGGVGW